MNENVSNATHRPPRRIHDRNTYVFHHDFEGPARLSTSVVHAISDVTGVDPTDAGFCLYDHVDPEALDRLFGPKPDGTPRAVANLTFTVWGYRVTVDGTGRIAVVPPRTPPDAPPR